MEKLQSSDIDQLLQELEEEGGVEEPLTPEVEELLQDLQSDPHYFAREAAARKLGKVGTSGPRIVHALIAAYQSDPYSMVNRASAESLRAPVHQEYLQQHPDLMEATESALEQRPGADEDPRGLSSGRARKYEGVEDSALLGIFHDQRWKWAPIYGIVLVIAAALVLTISGGWTFVVAGVVWFAGAVLGLAILEQKGYPAIGVAFGSLDFLDDFLPLVALVLLALIVLAGPVILLVALFVRPLGSATRISKRRAEAKDIERTKSSPVHGEPRLGCPACGAWNTPGNANCDECGAALKSAHA